MQGLFYGPRLTPAVSTSETRDMPERRLPKSSTAPQAATDIDGVTDGVV